MLLCFVSYFVWFYCFYMERILVTVLLSKYYHKSNYVLFIFVFCLYFFKIRRSFVVSKAKGTHLSIRWVQYYQFVIMILSVHVIIILLHYWCVICHNLYNNCVTKNQTYSYFYVYIISNGIICTPNHTFQK